MEEYTLISRKEVKKNKDLKRIQKESIKKYRRIKGHFPKAKIGKLVKLREEDCYIDLTGQKTAGEPDSGIDQSGLESEGIRNEILKQEVTGLSGSAFSTAQKLMAVIESNAANKYLIINGVECDPGLLHDQWLIRNRYQEVEKGIGLLAKCVPFTKIILATKEAVTQSNPNYEVCYVANRYPMGAEKILIREVAQIPVADGEIPAKMGILVLNVQTVYAIYEAVYLKQPADTRLITIADLTTGDAVIARVRLNADITDIITKLTKAPIRTPIYHGGGLMSGKAVKEGDRISARTNFIGYGKEAGIFTDASCKGCGACARKCPMEIKVNQIVQALEKQDTAGIKLLHPERCIKCGTCSYVCAAGKNTMELIDSCI